MPYRFADIVPGLFRFLSLALFILSSIVSSNDSVGASVFPGFDFFTRLGSGCSFELKGGVC
jgi:hypothetical protein